MSECRVRRSLVAAFLLAAVVPLGTATAQEEAEDAARQLSERFGLVKVTGRVWGLPEERELRQRLSRLPAARERIVVAEKDLEERIARNRQAWQQSAAALEAIKKQMAGLSSGDPQRQALERQRKALEAAAVEPAKLAGHGSVRSGLVQLGQERCALALDLVWIRRMVAAMAARYEELAANRQVAELVARTGERSRLGPARNYAGDVRKLAEYDPLAFGPHVPVWIQSGRVRVTAVVTDAACVTFTWSEASDAVTFLPHSAVEAAGIEIPADAPRERLRIEGRSIEARQIVLPSLRLGRCHSTKIAAYVLPPEAEDLGAQFTPQALSPCRAKLELERLRMAIEE